MPHHFGHLIRVLENCTDQTITAALASMDLTAAQGRIMGFIIHRQSPPCARDIEQTFRLSHPTVSGILSRLEQKGFIEFRPDENDRRCKRIYPLAKGLALNETMHQTILANEEKLVQDFSDEEKQLFAALLQRAITNMGGNICKRKHKEDSQL